MKSGEQELIKCQKGALQLFIWNEGTVIGK